jgi:hypothetical protein
MQQTARKKKKVTAKDTTDIMREVCCITYWKLESTEGFCA